MVKYKELFQNRNLKNLHIVLTSMIAELSKLGILNQGTTNVIGMGVGKKIAKCLKDIFEELPKEDEELLKFLIDFCDMCEDVVINGGEIGIKSISVNIALSRLERQRFPEVLVQFHLF